MPDPGGKSLQHHLPNRSKIQSVFTSPPGIILVQQSPSAGSRLHRGNNLLSHLPASVLAAISLLSTLWPVRPFEYRAGHVTSLLKTPQRVPSSFQSKRKAFHDPRGPIHWLPHRPFLALAPWLPLLQPHWSLCRSLLPELPYLQRIYRARILTSFGSLLEHHAWGGGPLQPPYLKLQPPPPLPGCCYPPLPTFFLLSSFHQHTIYLTYLVCSLSPHLECNLERQGFLPVLFWCLNQYLTHSGSSAEIC